MFQPHGTESGDHYKQCYIMLLSIMEDVRLCDDCQFCNSIRGVSVYEIIFMFVILKISHFK